MPTLVKTDNAPDTNIIAEFVDNIAKLNNGAMSQIGSFLATQSPAYRARVIERLSSMIGSIAELDTKI